MFMSAEEQLMERTKAASLSVAKVFYDFVVGEALPGAGIATGGFWTGLAGIVRDLAPRNRALLETRDAMQARIDDYHRACAAQGISPAGYESFLRAIGYLVPEPANFAIRTVNVDDEIAHIAGPQLVVPVSNARYTLNAVNARWGSLYDALYGSNAIPESGGAERGAAYNKVRGERAKARC
jgi:malate synthase